MLVPKTILCREGDTLIYITKQSDQYAFVKIGDALVFKLYIDEFQELKTAMNKIKAFKSFDIEL